MLVLVRGAVLSGIALLIAVCCVAASSRQGDETAALQLAGAVVYESDSASGSVSSAVDADPLGTAGQLVIDPAGWERAQAAEQVAAPVVPDVPSVSTAPADIPVESVLSPTRVIIEAVGIDMAVEPVGVQGDGSMQIPADVSIAGWYRWGSDLASTSGTTVIAAHVDSLQYGLGPFARLTQLQPGAIITLMDEAGQPHPFVLSGASATTKADLPVDQIFSRDGSPRLVLITCGGSFDRQSLTYSDNVILTADPAPADGATQ